ncbi:hypothetical protein [Pseudomonas sp. BMS12]|uniref:hypothetical protein n=1 Tax=Pseudomonas sp. BMS12 TaxID=1796033 RepID=UPI00083B7430|nr:hypothetical protein [Pseudomonas sp. BMS12]
MIARLFGLLGLVSCLLSGATANADELQELRLALSGSLGDFYLLYGVDADPGFSVVLERRLQHGERLVTQLATRPPAMLETWQRYRTLLQSISNEIQQGHIPDGNSVASVLELNRRLMADSDSLGPTPDELTGPERLALRLQYLTTDYIAYSIGANALGSDSLAIDEQARNFSSDLLQMLHQAAPRSERQRRLQAIARKWRYIEPSLMGYEQRAVPSLMRRYSTSIIGELTLLAAAD